jgi:hypothetical protein
MSLSILLTLSVVYNLYQLKKSSMLLNSYAEYVNQNDFSLTRLRHVIEEKTKLIRSYELEHKYNTELINNLKNTLARQRLLNNMSLDVIEQMLLECNDTHLTSRGYDNGDFIN